MCGTTNYCRKLKEHRVISQYQSLCSVSESCLTLYNPMNYSPPCLTLYDPMNYSPPLSMEFSRQEYWSGLPFPPLGDLPDPGMEPVSLLSPALAGRFFTTSATWEAPYTPPFYMRDLGSGGFWYLWIFISSTDTLIYFTGLPRWR